MRIFLIAGVLLLLAVAFTTARPLNEESDDSEAVDEPTNSVKKARMMNADADDDEEERKRDAEADDEVDSADRDGDDEEDQKEDKESDSDSDDEDDNAAERREERDDEPVSSEEQANEAVQDSYDRTVELAHHQVKMHRGLPVERVNFDSQRTGDDLLQNALEAMDKAAIKRNELY